MQNTPQPSSTSTPVPIERKDKPTRHSGWYGIPDDFEDEKDFSRVEKKITAPQVPQPRRPSGWYGIIDPYIDDEDEDISCVENITGQVPPKVILLLLLFMLTDFNIFIAIEYMCR